MMGNITRSRKRLTKKAVGSEDIDGTKITVFGKKPFWSKARYFALVSPQEEGALWTIGSFTHVFSRMKSSETAKEGIGLLRKVAEAVSDPDSSLKNELNDTELLCIAMLENGPLSLADIAEFIRLEKEPTSMVLGGLETLGIVRRCRRRGDPPKGYTLTKKGKKKAELLADEKDHWLADGAKARQEHQVQDS